MKTRLIRVGNSRGLLLPKLFIEQAGFKDEVEIELRKGAIVIVSTKPPRSGWEKAAKQIHERDEDLLFDSPTPTHFDQSEWQW
jgi:antitoxin MazE